MSVPQAKSTPKGRRTEETVLALLRELPMFEWRQCPEHPVLAVSVIVIADAPPWCVGGAEVHGHWLDPEMGAVR
jgi:hypothetical protein